MDEWVAAVVPAGGYGTRMESETPKQFLQLGGVPLLIHALRVLESSRTISEIVLVVPRDAVTYCQKELLPQFAFSKISAVTAGGARRQDSVWNGLQTVDERTKIVVVHDAVRPFVTGAMVEEVVGGGKTHGAAIVAIPLHDTVKQVAPDGMIETTLDRQRLWSAQTPQAFDVELLREAHRSSQKAGVEATDDAFLVERIGRRVSIVNGSPDNIKITRPEDLVMGEAILRLRTSETGLASL
ncbi:MAG: 2-C-methyl-D-erythritol 4-phosphate cytidylyltransferase [Nitrospira sp. SB0662_bin_26]|nr:2-C-methyl-D-erythritol 4-phosphate cytidylyltransferase [Nitrospira sp. SB0662_bin_26]